MKVFTLLTKYNIMKITTGDYFNYVVGRILLCLIDFNLNTADMKITFIIQFLSGNEYRVINSKI